MRRHVRLSELRRSRRPRRPGARAHASQLRGWSARLGADTAAFMALLAWLYNLAVGQRQS